MEMRQLGKSSLTVPAITFGAWAIGGAMWGGADEEQAIAAIRTSMDLGINAIDTAPLYGLGRSEELVAKAVAGKRDKVRIFTKFGLRVDRTEGEYFFDLTFDNKTFKVYKNARQASIVEECEASLRWLRTDYIDLYQCHWRDHTTPVEDTMEALAKLIKQGKIREAGVSNFTAEEIEAANRVLPLASDQPPYSMVNRGIEKDVLPYCREHNIGVIVYSPLQRGLLTGKFKPDHKFAPGDHRGGTPFFQPESIRRVNRFLDEIREIARAHSATLGQLVLNWTIRQPGITVALVGARDSAQARENAGAASFTLTNEEFQRINTLLGELRLDA